MAALPAPSAIPSLDNPTSPKPTHSRRSSISPARNDSNIGLPRRPSSQARPMLSFQRENLSNWSWQHGHTPIVECDDPFSSIPQPAREQTLDTLPEQSEGQPRPAERKRSAWSWSWSRSNSLSNSRPNSRSVPIPAVGPSSPTIGHFSLPISGLVNEKPGNSPSQLNSPSPHEQQQPRRASKRGLSISFWNHGRSASHAEGSPASPPSTELDTGVEEVGPRNEGMARRWSRQYSMSWYPRRRSEDVVYDPWKPLMPTYHRALGSTSSSGSFQSTISQEKVVKPWDSEKELHRVSRELLRLQKYILIFLMVSMNGALIWAGITYHEYYYIFLPFLCLNTFTQVFFAVSITISAAYTSGKRWLLRIPEPIPENPEKIVMLLPCYNEDRTEVETSLESLTRQIKIGHHPRLIFVVVDGQAKAPGEEKSTQAFLLEDMFAGGVRTEFQNGYCARDGFYMPVIIQHGLYKDVPYLIVGKKYNQGKRDSLCFARSFLWHYKNRSEELPTIFNPELFDYIGSVFTDYGLDTVDYLCGMDGDTEFDVDCVYELIKEMRRGGPKVVGVCGAVLVKFDEHPWGLWNLLQNTEYNMTQGLRRQFQSRVSGKVNCLPGCCQLIRIEEATFGDVVLRKKFGYVPRPNDTITHQIMGVYSEDSIHASVIFSNFPQSQTRQALKARAFTTAPQSWPVYLSQRKRWALGSKSNEFVMIFRPGIIWIERICSLITVITWWIGPFVITAVFTLFIALARSGLKVFAHPVTLGPSCVLLFRYVWSFCIVFWFPHNAMARLRFVVGYFIYLGASPFMNVIIMFYALLHCDEFSWGKTRAVAADDEESQLPHGSHGAHGSQVV